MPQHLSRNFQMTVGVIALLLSPALLHAQTRSSSYPETRRLLSKMERSPANGALKKLFETGDVRIADLIAALDDETHISVNSQVIIKYLADPQYLNGDDSDLSKLAMKNKTLFEAARFNSGDVSVRVVAYNKNLNVAL